MWKLRFGSLDGLRLECSSERLTVKPCQWWLRTPLDYLQSILTMKRLQFYALFLFLLFYSQPFVIEGKAQSECDDPETPIHEECTPTPEWRPIWLTPTPEPTKSYECPDGVPEGWGLRTPSPLWMASCSKCVPQTPVPTSTLMPWQETAAASTPIPYWATQTAIAPTATNTPEVTEEPVPEFWAETFHFEDSVQAEVVPIDKLYSTNTRGRLAAFVISYSGNTSNAGHGDAMLQELSLYLVNRGPTLGYKCYYRNTLGDVVGSALCDTYAPGAEKVRIGFQINHLEDGNFGVRYSTWAEATLSWEATVRFVYRSVDVQPPPQPTSTPVVSYCSSVKGYDPADPGELGLELPVPMVGTPTCTGIPAFEIDLSVLNWLPGVSFEAVTFPGLNICATPIKFGEVKFVGISVDLDILSLIMAAVVIIRYFTGR